MPKIGLFLALGTASTSPRSLADEIAEEAIWAEKYGFDSVVMTEHHCVPDFLPDPLMASMFVAGQTKRIKIGSYVTLVALCDPRRVAEKVAMLDVFSSGRVWFGVGLGNRQTDFEAFDIPMKRRVSICEEAVQIIKSALTDGRVSFEGKRFKITNFTLEPKPLQTPRPSIYIGASSIPGASRAGRLGDGLALEPQQKLRTLKPLIDGYRDVTRRLGKVPYVIVGRDGWLARDKETAKSEAGSNMFSKYVKYWSAGRLPDLPVDFNPEIGESFELMRDDRWIFGSADEGIALIEKLEEEYGIDELLIGFRQTDGNPSHKSVLNEIKLWGEQVIPYFRQR